jgi:hypothetical protein
LATFTADVFPERLTFMDTTTTTSSSEKTSAVSPGAGIGARTLKRSPYPKLVGQSLLAAAKVARGGSGISRCTQRRGASQTQQLLGILSATPHDTDLRPLATGSPSIRRPTAQYAVPRAAR